MKNIVILDLGSNSTRMSVNQFTEDGTFKEIMRDKVITRMAEGMGEDGDKFLQSQAIERTLSALENFKEKYQKLDNVVVRGIATAAVRMAKNQIEFIDLVKERIGVDIQILSGSSEAYYDYYGVIKTLPIKDFLLCDMGGGSFELVLSQKGCEESLVSIPYGAVSLSERYHAQDKISAPDLFDFQRFIQYKYDQLDFLRKAKGLPLVLLGGANRTVARYFLETQGIDVQQMHGQEMSTFSFLNVYHDWLSMSLTQRREALGEEADRADVIIGGLTPIVQLILEYQIPKVIFSESGVREGIMYEMLDENK